MTWCLFLGKHMSNEVQLETKGCIIQAAWISKCCALHGAPWPLFSANLMIDYFYLETHALSLTCRPMWNLRGCISSPYSHKQYAHNVVKILLYLIKLLLSPAVAIITLGVRPHCHGGEEVLECIVTKVVCYFTKLQQISATILSCTGIYSCQSLTSIKVLHYEIIHC